MPDSLPPPANAPPDLEWLGRAPRSRHYGDVYFSRDDGLTETRAVFLVGCDLPRAWAGRAGFTVAEMGFGTGLNIAALLHLWRETREPDSHLSVFTVEANPLTAAEAARALGAWPELAEIASLMTQRWPGRARGFHRVDLPELGATVDVAILEAAEALGAWSGSADAWFLDGFAPSRNPDIWRDEVTTLIAARSAPGARAATYTVAGSVRRSLSAAGFAVGRLPGHGRKRQRLEARFPGAAPTHERPTVAIVGAGIAGASLARAFRGLGVVAQVFDPAGPGGGASGAPACLMTPRLDAGLGPIAALFAQCAQRAAQLYDATPGAVIARGALQLAVGPKDPARFAAVAVSDLFEEGALRPADPAAASAWVGESVGAGLALDTAVVIRPRSILADWLGGTIPAKVGAVVPDNGAWRLLTEDGQTLARVDIVCLASAMACADLAPGLRLNPVRGQIGLADDVAWDGATMFGAYAIPADGSVLFGATHDRDDAGADLRGEDRARNLVAVSATLPALATRLSASTIRDWAAVRATTRDYLPLAGAVPDAASGLIVLTGLGSRGFCLAPLLAEHLAALCCGAPSPLPGPLADLVEPGRFAVRAARKGRPRPGAAAG